jgi:hypothetical protein
MKRATIFENGSSTHTHGIVLSVPETLTTFLETIRAAFDKPELSFVYTSKGGRICNVDVIR